MKRVLLVVIAAVLTSASAVAAGTASAKHPWLGLSIRPHTDRSGTRFLHVERVVPAGPSDRAGLRPGDIITAAGGTSIQIGDDLDFLLFVADRKPGERLDFQVVRAGATRRITVIVGVMPETARPGWNRALQMARQKRIAATKPVH